MPKKRASVFNGSSEQVSTFEGDLKAAQARLRDLTEIACRVLDAKTLNLASYHLCVYMDVATGKVGLTPRMTAELEAEQTKEWWRRFEDVEWGKA
jgi:hypothetical protein